ncbi:FAD-dependent oxidoreductase [Paenarthrobacter sp. Z7-10]|nr:FAD-dependent oxidoreductase [Paenarthrobacter sp. Z7-10]
MTGSTTPGNGGGTGADPVSGAVAGGRLGQLHLPHVHLPQLRKPLPPQPQPLRAIVVGGGIAGLVAARDLAAAGYRVTVLEAAASFGGCVGRHEVAGLLLDSGAESFATRSTAVSDLAAELGLGEQITAPDRAGAWVQLPDGPVPLPKTGVLGIPADPWAPEVRSALGLAGALRASADARLPTSVGTTAEVISVADLVLARMGRRVLERLVAPVVGGVHSADPAVLDVDMVAPGLRRGIVEHGSLAAAVAAQRTAGKAGAAVGGLVGGMHTLVDALTAALLKSGVALHAEHPVTEISRTAAPGDTAKVTTGDTAKAAAGNAAKHTAGDTAKDTVGDAAKDTTKTDSGSAPKAGGWRVTAGRWTGTAELLVMATDGPTAVALLAPALPFLTAFAPKPGPDVRLVTLVLDRPELDVQPRGTGILVAPQTAGIGAKALTHATAKWPWLAAEAGPGTHVLRLSYGRAGAVAGETRGGRVTAGRTEQAVDGRAADGGAPPESPEPRPGAVVAASGAEHVLLGDDALLDMALADASALLGQPLVREDLLGWDVVRWSGSLPFAAVGHRRRVAQLRERLRKEPSLLLTGGWLAGNGLAAVVADARAEVRRLQEGCRAASADG